MSLAPHDGAPERASHPVSSRAPSGVERSAGEVAGPGSDTGDRAARWRITWVAGPDAGRSVVVGPGEHVVGRSTMAEIRCDDPALEPFHARWFLGRPADTPPAGRAMPVEGAPSVTWCQLAGRRPVVADGADLTIGASVLRIETVGPHDDLENDADRADAPPVPSGVVVRTPRRRPAEPAPPVLGIATPDRRGSIGGDSGTAFEPDDAGGALVPSAVALVVGVALAVVVRQPMLALMGVVGAAVALGTWLVGRMRRRRRRTRDRLAAERAAELLAAATTAHVAAVERARRAAHPGIVGAWHLLAGAPHGLWCRRPDHGDAFTVVVGDGPGAAPALVDGAPPVRLDRVPTITDLGPGARTAVTGPWTDALTRSLVVQLAVTTGPADWELVVASDRPDAWQWVAGLPHLRRAPDGAPVHDEAAILELVTRSEHTGNRGHAGVAGVAGLAGNVDRPVPSSATSGRHLVVVTDTVDRIAVRTAAIRRLLHARPDAALLVACADAAVPALCVASWATAADGTVRPGDGGVGSLRRADEPDSWERSRLHGCGARAAGAAAAALARFVDPEADAGSAHPLCTGVALEALWAERGVPLERSSIACRWRSTGPDTAPAAPLGTSSDGAVEVDLVRDGPHGLIAGTTGSGKSELLRSLVLSLAVASPPDQLAFVLVDFKGGATFDGLAALPHVAGVVTDLEPRLTERVLRSLRAEVTRREHLLRDLGRPDLSSARHATGTTVVPRLVIVVDEFAALAVEHPQLLHSLVDVARRGRSLGVHLVLATQRPAGVVSDEIRTNTDLRIALRLHDASEAVDVVGHTAPAEIRRDAAGRAVMRLGPGELVPFQTARAIDAEAVVGELVEAARSLGSPAAERPWCDPLPDRLDSLPPAQLGLLDLPDQQRQVPLDWSPSEGHLLVVGSVGSGVTTALAGVALRRLAPDAELVVVDGHGDAAWESVATHPRCAGVARLHEVELLDRVLRRAVSTPPAGGRLVVVDGLAVLRRDLEPVARADTLGVLDSILLAPPSGVVLVIGNDGLGGLGPSVVSRCARRWVLHLHDDAEAAGLGVRGAEVPRAVAGRVFDTAHGCEGQLAVLPDAARIAGAADDVTPVERVRTLPAEFGPALLPVSWSDERSWFAPLALGHDDLGPVVIEVPEGEHVLVLGPARSGRSEVLAGLRRCWSQARPDGAQVVVSPRRLSGRAVDQAVHDAVAQVRQEASAGRPVLLVIDDAELVGDPTGVLAAVAGGRDPCVTVAVACRPDTVRSAHAHWAAVLRRHRRGVLMASSDDLDGDLLGVVLPRHLPLAVRPGLCWVIADGSARLAQAARRGEALAP